MTHTAHQSCTRAAAVTPQPAGAQQPGGGPTNALEPTSTPDAIGAPDATGDPEPTGGRESAGPPESAETGPDAAWPAWLREIDALLAVHSQFVLSGNVHDRYRLPLDDMPLADSISDALLAGLRGTGFDALLVHDIVGGYRIVSDDQDAAWADVVALTGRDLRTGRADDLDQLAGVVRAFAGGGVPRLGLVLEYASRLAANVTELSPREHAFFTATLKCSHEARPHHHESARRGALYNPMFWIVEREHDLPAWLTAGNLGIRAIPVPWPSLTEREETAALLTGAARGGDRAHAAEAMATRTEGMNTASLFDIATLLADQRIDYSDAEDAVRVYTLGAAESPWRRGAAAKRLREHDMEAELSKRVRGQRAAVTKAADILRRASLGLSGAQAGENSSRPRGVLFFAGPTGVGKTELAKAITELVFGTEDAYVRFDMSEFTSEHAGDRLVGAPPGYIGFEGGGELTNAVRRKPYTLLLFDEIEKAHPRILDKFLQLLDDGRLTDGRGTTVHFSDTLIVFTSNLGMTRPARDGFGGRVPTVTPTDAYDTIEARVVEEIRRYFTEDLNRPELLNRVGDNLVVFDYIRRPVAVEITDAMLANIAARVEESAGTTIEISSEARLQLHELAIADLSFGGRGIGNVLEARFVNPLARALFTRGPSEGARVEVAEVSGGSLPEVVLR